MSIKLNEGSHTRTFNIAQYRGGVVQDNEVLVIVNEEDTLSLYTVPRHGNLLDIADLLSYLEATTCWQGITVVVSGNYVEKSRQAALKLARMG